MAEETTDPGHTLAQIEFSNRQLVCTRAVFGEFFIRCFHPPTVHPTPKLKTLKKTLKSVEKWHLLGKNLGLNSEQLNKIDHDDVEHCRTKMLKCWLGNTTTPTWKTVADALDQMEECRLADEIRRKYG